MKKSVGFLLLVIIFVIMVTAAFWWSENNHDHVLPGSEAGTIPSCGEDCSIFGDECGDSDSSTNLLPGMSSPTCKQNNPLFP